MIIVMKDMFEIEKKVKKGKIIFYFRIFFGGGTGLYAK